MKADARTEAEVKAVLDRMAEGYAKKDLEEVIALFAPDPDVTLIGTGVDEKRVGHAEIRIQAERDFSQSDSLSMSYAGMSVSVAGSIAWAAADFTVDATAGGEAMKLSGRMTAVLEKRAGTCLTIHPES